MEILRKRKIQSKFLLLETDIFDLFLFPTETGRTITLQTYETQACEQLLGVFEAIICLMYLQLRFLGFFDDSFDAIKFKVDLKKVNNWKLVFETIELK